MDVAVGEAMRERERERSFIFSKAPAVNHLSLSSNVCVVYLVYHLVILSDFYLIIKKETGEAGR